MKKLIIYDLDGTLADTGKDIARAANAMRQSFHLEALPEQTVYQYVGKGMHYLVGSVLGTEDRKKIEKAGKIYRAFYQQYMMDHSALFPGTRDVLEYFKNRIQAVMTNKPDPFSTEMLKALGVAGYFKKIIAGDSEFPKKPNPAALIVLMREHAISAHEALMVGDSLIDLETARRARMPCVLLSHGFTDEASLKAAAPDGLFNSFDSFLNYAREKKW